MKAKRPYWARVLLPAFVALLGTNLLAFAVWTGPRTYRQRNAAARAQAAREELERSRAETTALRERAAAVRVNATDLPEFYRMLGSGNAALMATIEEIESMVRTPGLRPGGRTLSRSAVEDAALERVALTLPVSGSYAQLIAFLRQIEASKRFITVDRVAMREEDAGRASLQVELSAYLSTGLPNAAGAARSGESGPTGGRGAR